MSKTTLLFSLLSVGIVLQSCKKDQPNTTPPATSEATILSTSETYELIQSKILTPQCATAGCHASTSDQSYHQHHLVLAAGQSYQNLININPSNAAALQDSFLLVKPRDVANSFLYYKLDAAHQNPNRPYGSVMPLGGNNLSAGQLEFIKRWIEAGAPQTGKVVDWQLLTDANAVNTNFMIPQPPPAGQGLQVHLPAFEVQANSEREFFIAKTITNTDIYVHRIENTCRPGSHHIVMYDFINKNDIPPLERLRDLYNPDGSQNLYTAISMSNHLWWAGVGNGYSFQMPAGVAIKLPANAPLDFNVHYFNTTNETRIGESWSNIYTMPQADVQHVAESIFFNNDQISIPAHTCKTETMDFFFEDNVKIVMLTAHMHKLGETFEIRIKGGSRDGQSVYVTQDWEHPEVLVFNTPLELQAGEGLTSVITYNNTTAERKTFGLLSTDEMGIIFGYYYKN